VGAKKGGESSSPPCLSCLLKLQLEATNNRGKKKGVVARNCSPRMRKKKQGEEKEAKKEGEKKIGKKKGKKRVVEIIKPSLGVQVFF
jgi:hypothetical protein